MGIFDKLFGKKEIENIPDTSNDTFTYSDFWNWFEQNEKKFHEIIKSKENVAENMFDLLSEKLDKIRIGYFFLVGMCDDDTAEIIITAEGNIQKIVFVEELIAQAPSIDGWKFTALKPSNEKEEMSISMGDYEFSKEQMSFYAVEQEAYPDIVEITVVHNDYTEDNKKAITNGVYIYLDNNIGELEFATAIDYINVENKSDAQGVLIPMEKLKSYLIWRQKEFIEKYKGTRKAAENDNFSVLTAEYEDGTTLIATVNVDLLNWDEKASHPWFTTVFITFDGENNNGMPDTTISAQLNNIEDEIFDKIKNIEGNLNIGRQTHQNIREIYFASKDFRLMTKIIPEIIKKHSNNFKIEFDIYKDKYWKTVERFIQK